MLSAKHSLSYAFALAKEGTTLTMFYSAQRKFRALISATSKHLKQYILVNNEWYCNSLSSKGIHVSNISWMQFIETFNDWNYRPTIGAKNCTLLFL